MTPTENRYPLGSDLVELERLDHQGRMLGPATRMLFDAAGCWSERALPTPAAVGVETLDRRMRDELADAHAVFAFPPLVSAWATKTS
jgi:hypothetical protein